MIDRLAPLELAGPGWAIPLAGLVAVLLLALLAAGWALGRRRAELAAAQARLAALGAELERRDALMQAVAEALPTAVLVLDAAGSVRCANRRADRHGLAGLSGLPDRLSEAARLGGAVVAVERLPQGIVVRTTYLALDRAGFLVSAVEAQAAEA